MEMVEMAREITREKGKISIKVSENTSEFVC